MKLWQTVVFVAAGCLAGRGALHAADAPSAEKTSQPVTIPGTTSRRIESLIRELGASDFRQREAAAESLRRMGTGAVPALKRARDTATDPEVASRADSVVRHFEGPAPARSPGGTRSLPLLSRAVNAVRLREPIENGGQRVEIHEPGRVIQIVEGPNGIEMTVSGDEDGQPVTLTFHARTSEQLQQQNPEAFALFKRAAGRGRGGLWRRGMPANGRRVQGQPVRAGDPLRIGEPVRVGDAPAIRLKLFEAGERANDRNVLPDVQELLRRQGAGGVPAGDPEWEHFRGILGDLRARRAAGGAGGDRPAPRSSPSPAAAPVTTQPATPKQ